MIVAGKYELFDLLGTGGMASVHLGRVVGPLGFSRLVAIKQIHPHLALDPAFVDMFLDEGRVAARIHHPNVVATLDVVAESAALLLVLEYVHGVSLTELLRPEPVAVPVASAIVSNVLAGLHAAHEARGDNMRPLEIVHRDVSPQNVLVGEDGVARVLDFGIARATMRVHTTKGGAVRGKVRYMAPEQLHGEPVDRRVDVYAAAVVLWEMLTGRRLHDGDDTAVLARRLLDTTITPPSAFNRDVPPALDALVLRALAPDRTDRFETALAMADALEIAAPPARAREVGAWVRGLAGAMLDARARRSAELVSSVTGYPSSRTRQAPADEPTAPLIGAAEGRALELDPSVVDPPPTARAPWRRRAAALGAVLLVSSGAALLGLGLAGERRSTSPVRGAPPTTASSAGVSASSAPAEQGPAVPVDAPPASAAAPSAARDAGIAGSGKRPRRAPRPGCTPPYVIEADGTKRFRPECL